VASGKKKQNTAGTARKSGRPSKRGMPVEEPNDSFIRAEVLIIASFAAAVLLFLSNFHLCGVAGDFLRSVQLGVFGFTGFIAPLLLFVGTTFYMSNRGNPAAVRKLAASVVAVLTLCGFAQMFFGAKLSGGEGLMDCYKYSSVNGAGGGLVGGAICMGLVSVLGTVGACLVLAVLFIISAVCITEKSLVRAVKQRSNTVYQHAREDIGRRREIHAERQEERRRMRKEQRVSGVNLSSTDLAAGEERPEAVETPPPSEQAARAAAVSRADVFTGKINMPPQYAEEEYVDEEYVGEEYVEEEYVEEEKEAEEEDPVLKGARPVYAAMTAQQLVEEGISRMRNADALFPTYESFPSGGASRHFYDTPPESEVPWEEQQDMPDPDIPKEYIPEQDVTQQISRKPYMPEQIPQEPYTSEQLPQESYTQEEISRKPYTSEQMSQEPYTSEQLPQESYTQEQITAEQYMPEQISRERRMAEQILPEQDMTEEYPPESPDLKKYQPDIMEEPENGIYIDMEASPYAADGPSPGGWDESGSRYQTPPRRADSFTIPAESRRVVTSSGKVIESDTEALQKKLERRRREAEEGDGEGSEKSVQQQIRQKEELPKKEYVFPSVNLLKKGRVTSHHSDQEYRDTAVKLQQTLRDFGVGVTVTNISCGPSVTRYELHPDQGIKVSRIVGLTDDIKLSLAAAEIRIEAPIPGKSAVGIEVPNKENSTVYLRELLESDNFRRHPSQLAFAVGKDIGGQVVVTDIAKMPHLLIAGATGSGKSVCINTLIMSIIYKANPEDVKLIMVDPKVVELSIYNGIPHLLIPVVTDPKKASGALNWAVAEMDSRYKKFAQYGVRDLKGYNAKIEGIRDIDDDSKPKKMAQIVIIIDELADLMMVAPGEVEDSICRLAQLARAAGIHLVIATQRPSVNVITGLIKANVPSRIAFSVSSGVDSRTIIDMNGAEKLLGKGDMLFYPAGYPKPQRVQGAFVSDQEVQAVVDFLTEQGMTASYSMDIEKQMSAPSAAGGNGGGNGRDEYFGQAGAFIIEKEKASIGMLQRMFKIGFNRAARIMDQLSEAGVVGPEEGTKPRKIMMTMEEFNELLSRGE